MAESESITDAGVDDDEEDAVPVGAALGRRGRGDLVRELLTINEVLKRARKAFDDPESAAQANETSQIDQLQGTFGFIKSYSPSEGRLFFHFKDLPPEQPPDSLKIGDSVEFRIRRDPRGGNKRVQAYCVSKTGQNTANQQPMQSQSSVSSTVLEGTVVSPCKPGEPGKIAHVFNGEYFFLPYTKESVRNGESLNAGELVFFQVASGPGDPDSHASASWAVNVHRPAASRCRGIVSSLKDNYGFIEREDRVQDVHFHFSGCPEGRQPPLGAPVEFSLQLSRSGRETATDIVLLPAGSVTFADIDQRRLIGTLLRLPTHQRKEPLTGQVSFQCPDTGAFVQLPFGSADLSSRCSLRPGDRVAFNAATDRRDRLRRATAIELDPVETFGQSYDSAAGVNSPQREPRRQGVVHVSPSPSNKGLLVSDSQSFQFDAYELVGDDLVGNVGDLVQFSVSDGAPDVAVRLCRLPAEAAAASADRLTLMRPQLLTGVLHQADTEPGIIMYNCAGREKPVCCPLTQISGGARNDRVQFQLLEFPVTGASLACNVRLIDKAADQVAAVASNSQQPQQQPQASKPASKSNSSGSSATQQQPTQPLPPQPRPDRLRHRLKTLVDAQDGPRLVLIRQPARPDGTKG
uniref:CSD domain-containing protein n=1 Tax=Macrostomum lignano TaxID=282301 RepID=A0A1I8GAW3_9PLAT